MKNEMINDRIILMFALTLLILSPLALLSTSSSTCQPTRFIGHTDLEKSPEEIVNYLIQKYNGLPKISGDLSTLDTEEIYPVAEWQIVDSHIRRSFSLWHDLFDDDPTYGINADIQVRYSDGSSQMLHWNSWRYGLAVCPLVFAYGDGPPGAIEVLAQ